MEVLSWEEMGLMLHTRGGENFVFVFAFSAWSVWRNRFDVTEKETVLLVGSFVFVTHYVTNSLLPTLQDSNVADFFGFVDKIFWICRGIFFGICQQNFLDLSTKCFGFVNKISWICANFFLICHVWVNLFGFLTI